MFKVTVDWIKYNATYSDCAWNKKQLDILGVRWPPRRGWLKYVSGIEITNAEKALFESYKGTSKKSTKKLKSVVNFICPCCGYTDYR